HVIHVLRRRRMQRNHQERVTISPTPIPQRTATRRPWSHSVLHRRQPQALRFFLQNEPVAVLIQEQLNSLIQWPTSRHNRSDRHTTHPTRRRHKIRGHSLSHKHVLLKGRNQANFALTTSTLFIRFSELILIAHIRWTI